MLGLGIKEFQRRIFTNLFTAIQLSVILVVIIAVVSSVQSRTRLYLPVKNALTVKGVYCSARIIDNYTEEDIKNNFPGTESVISAYIPEAIAKTDYEYHSYAEIAYDETLIGSYAPKLKDGKWFTEPADHNDTQTIYAVVYDDRSVYKVGDRFELSHSYYSADDITFSDPIIKTYNVQIIGVMEENSMIFGLETTFTKADDFRNLYTTPYRSEKDFIAIFSKTQLEGFGISSTMYGTKLITFSDTLSESEAVRLTNDIDNYTECIDMQTFGERSRAYVYRELLKLYPLLICVSLLVIVSTISISALNTKGSLRSFAIYYICGLQHSQCIVICLINSILTSLMACMAAVIISNVTYVLGILGETVISVSTNGLTLCAAAIILQIGCSMIMPILLMNKRSLKDTVTMNE